VTAPRVLPLGHYLGMLPVAEPGGSALKHVVRLAGRRVVVAEEQMLVWALAHGIPRTPDLGRWTRAEVRANLPDDAAGTDVDAVADRLVGTGLLLEVGESLEEFARAVRLLPGAVGVGNSVSAGRTFGIGYPGTAMAAVPTEVFFLWSFACLEPDLWTACARGAVAALPLGDGDPRLLVSALLHHLHLLLSSNVAWLDRALS
jgi:hypothetical protein